VLDPKFAGSSPGNAIDFKGNTNPQHTFLRMGSKAGGPMFKILRHAEDLLKSHVDVLIPSSILILAPEIYMCTQGPQTVLVAARVLW
jgi:hypothetical protein